MADFVLFLDRNSNEVRKIPVSEYEDEARLQEMIKSHPEVLSLPSSEKIVSLAIEYPLPTGAVDIVCVDREGRLYIIETKLQKNYDKRKAIAQLIEYASQIALRDNFETFSEKIRSRTGKKLEEIIGGNFGEEDVSATVEGIKRSLSERKFILVLVMDKFDEPLKDMIIYLNRYYHMDIFGVELARHIIDQRGEVFDFNIIGAEVAKEAGREPIASEAELLRQYSDKGLGSEIKRIIEVFDESAKKYENVRIVPGPKILLLQIGEGALTISLNINPKRDHGVWVYDVKIYDEVIKLGRSLRLEVRKSEGSNYGKIIFFNDHEGIKQVAPKMSELVSNLVKICGDRSRV